MPAPQDMSAVLAQLRERYLASSAPMVQAFDDLASQLERNPDASEVVQALRRELHRVRGTAGSYGFHETSRLAAALEPMAVRWAADGQLDRGRRAAIVRRFVSALRDSLQPAPSSAVSGANSGACILLVGLSDTVETRIAAEAMHRGHRVEVAEAADVAGILAQRTDTSVVSAASAPLDVPPDVGWVVLREGVEPVPAARERLTVLDMGVDARDVVSTLETRATSSPLAGCTVLLVEDDEHLARLLRALGERQGMFVEARGDAHGIRQVIDTLRPSLVLLDINLPGPDGFAVTRDLRSDERYRELPIIMMSVATDVETRSAAFTAGADDFQSKPVSPDEIMRRIERVLESHQQRLIARGVHPVTGLLLPERARHVLGAAIAAQAARAEPVTIALLRPRSPLGGLAASAAWHRELRLLAGALGSEGVRLGFRDEVAAVAVFGMPASEALGRLDVLAEASSQDVVSWCSGIVELRAGAEPNLLELVRLAEEAWQLSKERGLHAHIWDATDAGIAPDVVVVEDDDSLADLVAFALSARGLTWVRYSDGPAALAGLTAMRVQGRAPIVLLDVDLPGLDGFSVFERLRVERPGVFRVVFTSVHGSEADQLRAIRAGALDYLIKPISLRVLLAKIVIWRAGAVAP